MHRTLISTALFATALVLGPVGCDSGSSDSNGATDSGGGTDSNAADPSSSSTEPSSTSVNPDEGTGTTSNPDEGTGTTLNPDEGSSGEFPADCSCYDPVIDQGVDKCLDTADLLPGCAIEESPCPSINRVFENDSSVPVGPPTPEGAVTCVVEALAQGQTPPISSSNSDDFSGSSSTLVPLDDGTYVRDNCYWLDIGGGQAVNRVLPSDAEYFSDCLAEHEGDEASMYECLMGGLEIQIEKDEPPAKDFPACG